jgi:maleylpyruvate isomerase
VNIRAADGQLPRRLAARIAADIEGCRAADRRLLASLDGLTDAQARRPSLLPEWSVGHVLTHTARNADSLVGMLQGAERGEVVAQYPSMQARNDDIDAGGSRPADELVADVRAGIERLDQQWSTATPMVWQANGVGMMGPVPIADLPARRWREVEVHHGDLGLGFTFVDWSPAYVRMELPRIQMLWASRQPMGLTGLPPAALAAAPVVRLAWLLGRTSIDGLSPAGVF